MELNTADSIREIVSNLNYKVLGVGLAFTLTGFVMFMFMFAAFASLVSKVEDVNGAVMLPMLAFMQHSLLTTTYGTRC